MRRVVVIGVGVGDPDQLTFQGAAALAHADVLLTVEHRAAVEELEAPRRAIKDRHARADVREIAIADDERGRGAEAVAAWRARRAARFADALSTLQDGQTAAILAWGDPSLYDGTLAVLEDARAAPGVPPFDVEVIPGVSAPHALAARHGVVLTRTGRPVTILPGRLLQDGRAPEGDLVVMLDPACAFLTRPDHIIYWGAYINMPGELLISGRVGDVGEEIAATRARAKDERGWMFDTYLLRTPD
ncbi:precorrin-6A synthase (deacetylating) [Conexibacter woesei]|uniref:precorrin-6A synthase (deacetylating) n=1 Tax=Conexibacter woesei TaxID=191495 RepID=UPI0003FFE76B|nr:precorrin-6A synthase (deacetylating) [Conexibacter woesei]